MSDAFDRALAEEAVQTAERTRDVLQRSLRQMRALGPLTAERLPSLAPVEQDTVDAFLKRFENAVESGKPLLRAGLLLRGESVRKLSLIDLLNTAEKFDILPSAWTWRDALETRNKLAHEYSMKAEQAAVVLSEVIERSAQLIEQLNAAVTAVRALADGSGG